MQNFFGGVLGVVAFILFAIAWGQRELGAGVLWGLLALALLIGAALLSQNKSKASGPAEVEDLAAKENNRQVALQLAEAGGLHGIQAKQWLRAYDGDASVPIYGVRPYWTPTGPGGSPQLLSMIGLRSVDERLHYVREANDDDSLLPIMADDPNSRVRDAARARLR